MDSVVSWATLFFLSIIFAWWFIEKIIQELEEKKDEAEAYWYKKK